MTKEDAMAAAKLAILMAEYLAHLYTRPNYDLPTFEEWLERKVAREEVAAKADRCD